MDNKSTLFTTEYSVNSDRILYTPSSFARAALLYLQETGTLTAIKPHISDRAGMNSFLCFIVEDGEGILTYENCSYKLRAGDCVFINCKNEYSHSTGYDGCRLWSLRWCHFYSESMFLIYEKYRERGGLPVFHPDDIEKFKIIMSDIYNMASSSDYIRDMKINELLSSLVSMLMAESWNPEYAHLTYKKLEIVGVKEYLDGHYIEKITLDELASRFFISKYYMLKLFNESYGITINNYINNLRITKAKQLLRFSDMRIEEIGHAVGMEDANYFSRAFKKIEGISPSEYRKMW